MNQEVKSPQGPNKVEKKSEEKIPWWFNLQVKDLVKPITIKRMQLLSAGALLLALIAGGFYAWENFLREPTGAEFVDEIVDAAGGLDTWKGIEHGQFTRTHNLYDDSGELLKSTEETFYFKRGKEGLKLQVKSVGSDDSEVVVGKDDEGFWATKDNQTVDPMIAAKDEGMMCDSKFCDPQCASSMAFFRFSMPFKLKDSGVNASLASTGFNIAELNLLGGSGKEPTLLDISYDRTVGKDSWRFYVDPQDKLIHKVEYYNKSDKGEIRPEEIYWTDHKTVDGITFSHRWTRYWPNGKVMDEYVYSDVNLDSELPDEFFNRRNSLGIADR
ncbi:outer membrane lipoprotein-sorting protein [Maribacter algarum]|uniref:Outer membrane lipoprotein-sorting protein n=1 Tax=Maribacter algarum (ex Zhang et al. 2020) TaxID=2578118 RepID=A0A5S3PPZ9_9FLAO|nr:DUF6503 family protein [Maribacter algarum]TMM56709.1 outer membrane lipoprotein-sorting protein [Maribacter algarum]